MISVKGKSAGIAVIATFDENDPALEALWDQGRVVEAAPSFNVALIKPVDFPITSATAAAPSISWGVEAVGALNTSFDGRGVTVAVLDTGIDRGHPAFTGVEVVEEDFTGEGNGDQNGHGTHCAGTICGRDVDGTRIGIARSVAKLLVGKVLGKDGGGSTQAIYDAMQWALRNGAHVISMSLGMDFPASRTGMPPDRHAR
jgi:subtilisin family serine protease